MPNESHECACAERESLFVPREAKILHAHAAHRRPRSTSRCSSPTARPLKFQPGQILEVGVMGYGEIPIGIASSPTRTNTFEIVVRTVGRVSTAINSKNIGDSLWVRGPLGHGFDVDALRGHDVLVVAGGIGICPTRSLIQYIADQRDDFGRFVLFYGARDPLQLLFPEDRGVWRATHGIEYHETVDRADISWTGNVGVITTLFRNTHLSADTRVIICGPPVMFEFVIRGARRSRDQAGEHLRRSGASHEVRCRQVRTLPDQRQVLLHRRTGVHLRRDPRA